MAHVDHTFKVRHGEMGAWGHGSIRSPTEKSYTPLGLDMGTWGLVAMGT